MAAAQHTRGPWCLFPTETGWIVNEVGGPGYVCTLPSVSHRREECKANADLIGAAPELLSQLRNTSFLLMSACLVIEDADAREVALAAVKRADAAIVKATRGAA